MSLELATQHLLLFQQRSVTVEPTPLPHLPQRAAEAGLGRLALHDPTPLPGAPLVVGEAEQVESALPLGGALRACR